MTALSMFRGDTPSFSTIVKSAGTPVTLDDLSIRFTAKRKITDADSAAVISLTVGDGVTPDPIILGRVVVGPIPASATSSFTKETELVWDLQLSDDVGGVETVDSGTLRVKLDVSRESP